MLCCSEVSWRPLLVSQMPHFRSNTGSLIIINKVTFNKAKVIESYRQLNGPIQLVLTVFRDGQRAVNYNQYSLISSLMMHDC